MSIIFSSRPHLSVHQFSGARQQGSSNQATPVKKPLLFGWGPEQHDLIEDRVSVLIHNYENTISSPTTLAEFLAQNSQAIHDSSREIDLLPPPGEIRLCDVINLDSLNGCRTKGMEKDVLPYRDTPLVDIAKHFPWSQRKKKCQNLKWQDVSGFQTTAEGYTGNVLSSSEILYEQLVALFRDAHRVAHSDTSDRVELEKAIAITCGHLLQYIADTTQPFHTTVFATGKLPYSFTETEADGVSLRRYFNYPGKKDGEIKKFDSLHSWLEGQQVTEAVRDHLDEANKRDVKTLSTATDFHNRLMKEVKQAYRQIFSILKIAIDVQNTTHARDVYFDQMAQRLSPIVQRQMSAALKLGADVIWSAYVQAGSPDLSLLSRQPLDIKA